MQMFKNFKGKIEARYVVWFKALHMVRARGDIKLFPSECGPWRVRLLCKVVQIVGLVGFYSDVVVEKWSNKDEIWRPVKMSRKAVKNSNREHIHFRCSGLSSSHVYLHHFVYFCTPRTPWVPDVSLPYQPRKLFWLTV